MQWLQCNACLCVGLNSIHNEDTSWGCKIARKDSWHLPWCAFIPLFSFLAPCKQLHYAWCLSLSLSQLAQYSFHIQLLYMSQRRGPILSHLASLPDSVEITYPCMQTHSYILILTPVFALPTVMHIHQQLNWQLAWFWARGKIWSESAMAAWPSSLSLQKLLREHVMDGWMWWENIQCTYETCHTVTLP